MEKELTEKKIRAIVKEVLENSMNLKEFDLIIPKKKYQCKDEATTLRKTLVELMINIENDNFSDGVKKINAAIKHLENWKSKIEKFI